MLIRLSCRAVQEMWEISKIKQFEIDQVSSLGLINV